MDEFTREVCALIYRVAYDTLIHISTFDIQLEWALVLFRVGIYLHAKHIFLSLLKTRHSTVLLDVDAIASKVLEGPRREAATELLGPFGITVGQPWSKAFLIRTI